MTQSDGDHGRYPDKYHGGLVFFDTHDHGLDGYCRIVASTLEDYGHRIDRQSTPARDHARITSHAYAVTLTVSPRREVGPQGRRRTGKVAIPTERLQLTLIPACPARSDDSDSQLLLLVMLYRMIEAYGARHVEWLNPATVLPAGRFMSAFAHVSPRRVRGRQEIIEIDDPRLAPMTGAASVTPICHDKGTAPAASEICEERALALAFRAESAAETGACHDLGKAPGRHGDNDIRRLAAWGMTGVVAFMSGPVGLSMAAVNLARGEDFRLSTQVLSLTGFLTVATSGTAMADVLALLPI